MRISDWSSDVCSSDLVYQESDIEKNSAYECGFQPFEDTRSKFNVRYYLIAILFMIFDLEIMYLFTWSISISTGGFFGVCAIFLFLVVLRSEEHTSELQSLMRN